MFQQPTTRLSQLFSYKCYLQYNAASHPDGFIAPKDWVNVWNMHQWALLTQPVQNQPAPPLRHPIQSFNHKAG